MRTNRRSFLRGAVAAASAVSATRLDAGQQHVHPSPPPAPATPTRETPPSPSLPGVSRVETPDLPTLGWQVSGRVKEFHLTAAPVRTEFLTGRPVDAWGFNGSMPGPTIEITQGDRVRIFVKNELPEPFSMHWHGLEVPIDMDGTPGISQEAIPPGGSFTYEFTIDQHGTFFYHSHMAMQELLPNNTIPNTMAMEFNWLTINGKSGPATTPLVVRRGERVRIRNVNLSMDHHPLHLHGNTFHVTGTEAGRIPQSAWVPGNTVLVGVAQARDIEFVASREGDWMLHCHLPHHMVNNMVVMAGPMMHGPSPTPPRPPGRPGEPDPTLVPGFPQDMAMDVGEMPAKPELHGLPKGWTAAMMGMMTLVRVLSPEMFGHVDAMRAAARGRAQ